MQKILKTYFLNNLVHAPFFQINVSYDDFFIYFLSIDDHLSPFFIILLLWYPCFENLFSIIRRVLKKKETVLADNSHLHHYLYRVIKNVFKNENYYINSLTGCIINAYNFIIFYFSRNYFYSSKFCISIIIFNITVYICSYYFLKSYVKNKKIP